MINESSDKIGTRELFAIIAFLIAIKSSDTTPTLLYKEGKNAAWIIPIIAAIIAFISLLSLLTLLKRYRNKSFMEIIFVVTGNFIGTAIGIFLSLQILIFTAINTRSYVDIINELFYPKTPIILLYIVLILSSYYISKRGFEAVGRTAWLSFPYINIIVVLYIILVWKLLKIDYLFPLSGPGVNKIITGGISNSGILSEIIFLSIFFPKIRSYKDYRLASLMGLGYVVFFITLFVGIYITAFDNPPILIINYPFQTLARLINAGRFLGNLEAFFLLFWVVSSIIRFSILGYMGSSYISATFKLKNVEKLILPFFIATILLGMIPENYFDLIYLNRQFILKVNSLTIYPLPIILLIISNLRRGY